MNNNCIFRNYYCMNIKIFVLNISCYQQKVCSSTMIRMPNSRENTYETYAQQCYEKCILSFWIIKFSRIKYSETIAIGSSYVLLPFEEKDHLRNPSCEELNLFQLCCYECLKSDILCLSNVTALGIRPCHNPCFSNSPKESNNFKGRLLWKRLCISTQSKTILRHKSLRKLIFL